MTEKPFKLLAIVAVDPSHRVRCQQPHCGHSVYARIHVVEDDGNLLVLGSDCFAKRYGEGHSASSANFSGGGGRVLTDAEREMLVNNTKALLAQFEAERLKQLELEELARQRERELHDAQRNAFIAKDSAEKLRMAHFQSHMQDHHHPEDLPDSEPVEAIPTPIWAHLKKQHSSFFAYGVGDGQCWVLMQSATHDGCFIAPAPTAFESWDEALPGSLGTVDVDRKVYVSDKTINVLSGWFVSRCKKGSRIDSDAMAIQLFALGCA